MKTIRLWDLPTRLFHWLLVAAVVGAVATVKLGTGWMAWHERFGLAVIGLLSFRLVWGLVGSTYARFGQFVAGPGAIVRYLQGQWQGAGHNPLGAWSVLLLLGLFGFQAVTGLFANDEIAFNGPLYPLVSSGWSDTLSSWHRLTEWGLYAVVALHVLAVMFYIQVRKDNLVKPMVTGRKPVQNPELRDASGGGWLAGICHCTGNCRCCGLGGERRADTAATAPESGLVSPSLGLIGGNAKMLYKGMVMSMLPV